MSFKEKTPQIISILTRKLKPGKTFKDFQEAHLPPGECRKTEFGYEVDYFPLPTRVINSISLTDPSIISSIGFSYGTKEQIFKAVEERLPIEAERAKKIAEVSEKVGPTQLFVVATDNNYGGAHQNCPQEDLIQLSPELLQGISEFLGSKKS